MSVSEQPPTEPPAPAGSDHTRDDMPPQSDPDVTRSEQPAEPPEADGIRFMPTAPYEPRSHDSRLPRRFGDYELLEELGRGGMGVVYRARHLHSGRLVALKMILSGALASPQAVERFRTEAQAAARLDHPNIVPIYEISDVEGQHFFTMQLLAGGTLQQRLQQGPLPSRQAAALVGRLAEAVQHAHQRGVLHRDLKPGNVLLVEREAGSGQRTAAGGPGPTPPGPAVASGGESTSLPAPAAAASGSRPIPARPEALAVKLTDFGLARMAERGGLTATGEQLGTPGYMSPEQAAGRRHEVGPASDVYSLGALLYCLLTGRPPFQAATALETMRLVLEQEPVPPRRLNPGVPRDVETVCLKCLEKAPSRRYPVAAELAEELARFERGEPIHARPLGRLTRGWRWCRRNPAVASLLAGLGLLFVLAAVAWGWHDAVLARREAEAAHEALAEKASELESNLYASRTAWAERELSDNNPARAAVLLEECPERLRGWEWRYLRRRCEEKPLLLRGHTEGIWNVAFSPDGKRLASASIDRTARIWDVKTGALLRTLSGHWLPVMGVAFSPDGRHVASASADLLQRGTVTLWDAETGKELFTLREHAGLVLGVAFAPDGRTLASCGSDGTVKLCDLPTRQLLHTLKGHTAWVSKVRFSPDGRRLVSVSSDGTARVWDLPGGQEALTLRGHEGVLCDASFSPDGRRLATPSWDGTVRVWDLDTGEATLTLRGHTGFVNGVAYSRDGRRLASTGLDRTVRVWDADTGQEVLTLRDCRDIVWSVAFSPDGHRLAASTMSEEKTIRVWNATPLDPNAEEPFLRLRGHTNLVARVAFSPDRRRAVSASWDRTVRVWDAATGRLEFTFRGHAGQVWSVAIGPGGRHVVSGGWDRAVKVWEAASGREVVTFTGHTHPVLSVAFSPDGARVASADMDGKVKVWDIATGQQAFEVAHPLVVHQVTFSADGKWLASCSGDRTAAVWSAATGERRVTLTGHRFEVDDVQFSPDGRRVVTASADHTLKVWDADTGKVLRTLSGHSFNIRSVAFSSDGKRLVSASLDNTVRVWDGETGQPLGTFTAHRGPVWCAAISPDGTRVLSASSHGQRSELLLWPLSALEREAPAKEPPVRRP